MVTHESSSKTFKEKIWEQSKTQIEVEAERHQEFSKISATHNTEAFMESCRQDVEDKTWVRVDIAEDEFDGAVAELRDNILEYLNNYDVVNYLEKAQIKYDSWLKQKFFELIGDIRTEIIMKFEGLLEKQK